MYCKENNEKKTDKRKKTHLHVATGISKQTEMFRKETHKTSLNTWKETNICALLRARYLTSGERSVLHEREVCVAWERGLCCMREKSVLHEREVCVAWERGLSCMAPGTCNLYIKTDDETSKREPSKKPRYMKRDPSTRLESDMYV